MARRNAAEVVAGAAVLLVAAGFLAYAIAHTGRTGVSDGYTLHASFDRIDGLGVGSDVRLAGVRIGAVTATGVDPKTYLANVTFTVRSDVKLPRDSSAEVTSEGLLGGKYLAVVPGGDTQMLADGGTVTITQSAVSLEQLLGKFIFSVTDMVNAVKAQQQGGGGTGAAANGAPAAKAP